MRRAWARSSRWPGPSRRCRSPPKRSILFLAVTAEEQGLLGSEYYARQPIYPLAKTLAAINVDMLNIHGRTNDITIVGLGSSDLDDYVRQAAAEQGRVVRADDEPEKGFYYRSDHFNFAKQGVPALDPRRGARLRRQAGGLRDAHAGGMGRAPLPQAVRRGEAGLGSERRRAGHPAVLDGRLPGRAGGDVSGVEAGQRVQGHPRGAAQGRRRRAVGGCSPATSFWPPRGGSAPPAGARKGHSGGRESARRRCANSSGHQGQRVDTRHVTRYY